MDLQIKRYFIFILLIFLIALGILKRIEFNNKEVDLIIDFLSLLISVVFVINQYLVCKEIEKQKSKRLILVISSSLFIISFALNVSMSPISLILLCLGGISLYYISNSVDDLIKKDNPLKIGSISVPLRYFLFFSILLYLCTGMFSLNFERRLISYLYPVLIVIFSLCFFKIFVKSAYNKILIYFLFLSISILACSIKIGNCFYYYEPFFSFWIYIGALGVNVNLVAIILICFFRVRSLNRFGGSRGQT